MLNYLLCFFGIWLMGIPISAFFVRVALYVGLPMERPRYERDEIWGGNYHWYILVWPLYWVIQIIYWLGCGISHLVSNLVVPLSLDTKELYQLAEQQKTPFQFPKRMEKKEGLPIPHNGVE